MEHEVMDEINAAKVVGLAPSTLAFYRTKRKGPPYLRNERGHVRYLKADLLEWKRAQKHDQTWTRVVNGEDTDTVVLPVELPVVTDVPASLRQGFPAVEGRFSPPSPDPAPRKAWDPPPFITEQAALPPTRKAQPPRLQPGEIRPPGVPSSAEWDGRAIAWVWEEDGETVMAGSDGERI